jgi:hypothetical protein
VTSPGDAGGRPLSGTASRRAPTWPRVAVVVGVFLIAFFVARSCQEDQINVTQEDAVAAATERIHFTPEDTQVRLLRQGLDRQPFWIVSLSTPGRKDGTFEELAVVRIDATSGEIVQLDEQKDAKRDADEAP